MIFMLYSETNLDELSMARADAIANAPLPPLNVVVEIKGNQLTYVS